MLRLYQMHPCTRRGRDAINGVSTGMGGGYAKKLYLCLLCFYKKGEHYGNQEARAACVAH